MSHVSTSCAALMGNATAAYSTGCQQQQQWHHTYTPPPICGCGHHMLEYISGCQQQQQRWHHTYTAANQWLRSSQCMSTSCASSPREGCRGILACVRCARVRFVYMARPAKWLKSLKVQVVEGVPLTTAKKWETTRYCKPKGKSQQTQKQKGRNKGGLQ